MGLLGIAMLMGCQTAQNTAATPLSDLVDRSLSSQIGLHSPLADAQEALSFDIASSPIISPAIPPSPDLWRDMRNNMHLALYLDQKRVQQEIRWLQRHPEYLKRLQPRLQTYLPYLYRQTQLRSMPAELALLPIVESALDTYAFSHGGAAGPWQFVRGTARQYGLEINDWYDGRRDIIASTDAALRYLDDLHKRFGDWYLALAGYNAGQGNVSRAQRRDPGAGFFDLRLPKETQAYVPRLLALVAVIHDPKAYDLSLPEVVPITTFRALQTHSQFQLSKLSQAIGVDMEDLYRWNPSLNQWATPPKGPHRIIVPASIDAKVAQSQIDAIPAKRRVDWTEIKVRQGDTLSQIAQRHGTDVTSLRLANNLASSRITAGKKLLIPKHSEALKTTPRSARGSVAYVVKPGDSLWTIARAHNVGLNKLMRNNHLGPKDTLSVGKTLRIPGTAMGAQVHNETRRVTRKVHYRVRKGDSLDRIANKFNVSIKQITNWNKLDARRYLQPGQGLLLYVNVLGG